ncbi:L,D-transpeptidase family protein [Bacillus sp. BRMEA1]|uniref:L,D-transpeptidase family protein n=1 Tax=Neobacillus endophyticus TaxID=2738405 RepID=UPI00156687C5|nr:L,D-transpeptidase family protein [Neobacillus endophyticus]NRD77279.1 L,D-transpeptidase family protein [Neobacillus endophyticus]
MRKLSVILVLLFSFIFTNAPAEAAGSSQLIIINKQTNTLAFYNAGKLVRTFSVATGKTKDLTPEGNFRIVTKIINRPYYKLGIPGGDPRNPMGNRFMGLDANGTYGDTYGIHGTNDESSIGKYISHGCVRMHNAEVHWLFDQVQLYTPVIITYSSSSFDTIAQSNGYNVISNGWVQVSGNWFYYVNGKATTGWMLKGSQWYYFDGNGVMKTGWVLYKGQWYYLDKSGVMKTGWALYKGYWYYLDKSGVMHTGWLSVGGKTYYLDQSGTMKTGWVQISGKWYYFNKDGSMAVNTAINGYKVGPDGAWIQVDYVALGDSLAAGMTPEGQDGPVVNGVDPNWGYPNYIAQDFSKSYQLLKFVNYGVSGYKTDNVLADLAKADVQNEIKKATHITIDIGANDVLPLLKTDLNQVPQAITTAGTNLYKILSTIDQLNPKAKVYVMGYYNPFPYYPQDQQAKLVPLLQGLNGAIQQDAVKNGATFVATDAVIAANYKNYITNPQNIHVSLPGYQVIAGEFWKVMQ